MKKLLIFVLLTCILLAGCGKSDFKSTVIVFKDTSIALPYSLAKAEFERIFAYMDGLEIIGADAAGRSDDDDAVVIEIAYKSEDGGGQYGFLCDTDENGNYYIVSHGKDITVEMLAD